MIKKNENKIIVGEIAKLFCENDLICQSSVKSRIIEALNDTLFETAFMPNLTRGRFYKGWISDYKLLPTHREYFFNTIDIVTGEVKREKITAGSNWTTAQFLGGIPNNLSFKGYEIIGGKQNFTSADLFEERIYFNALATTYGITYVPASVNPGSGSYGAGGTTYVTTSNYTSKPNTATSTPPAGNEGFNLAGISPLLLIGLLGAGAYFFLRK